MNKKEFGDWAVVFWKKGSKTLHIAQNQGDLGTTNYWMVGTTTRQFDYESGWLPNKEWTSTIKGHFSKNKAVQIAKENAMSAEFVKDSFFKNVPGSHHWRETVGNLAFVCSVDEDNCNRAHFSTYKNKKRIDSKYVYLNGDCVEQFYEYISNWV